MKSPLTSSFLEPKRQRAVLGASRSPTRATQRTCDTGDKGIRRLLGSSLSRDPQTYLLAGCGERLVSFLSSSLSHIAGRYNYPACELHVVVYASLGRSSAGALLSMQGCSPRFGTGCSDPGSRRTGRLYGHVRRWGRQRLSHSACTSANGRSSSLWVYTRPLAFKPSLPLCRCKARSRLSSQAQGSGRCSGTYESKSHPRVWTLVA